MKRIGVDAGRKRDAPDSDLSRRDFLRAGALGGAVIAAFGAGAGTLLLSKTASAQVIEIHGVKVALERLPDTLAKLEEQSAKTYRSYELAPVKGAQNEHYAHVLDIPSEGYLANTIILIKTNDGGLSVNFPKIKDKDPNRKEAGTGGTGMKDFITMIKRLANQDLRRVKMVMVKTTDPTHGDPVYSVYSIPVDKDNNKIGQYQGGQTAVGASYYPDRGVVYAARVLLLDPNAQPRVAQNSTP